MCGIAGILSKDHSLISRQKIAEGIACLRHRGPESNQTWLNDRNTVALAHSRLSIIDLDERAAQPLHYADRYTIIHNGEVYNYIELKNQLLQKGYQFKTSSDTEVIVAAYDAWGTECVQQFDGMFAFAIWDEKEEKLFAVRDRFGEKPFFFFYEEHHFVFASELKALWKLGVRKEVNRSMLYNFLTIGYTGNPGDPKETFYENVQKLPAASFLICDFVSGLLEVKKYWQVFPETDNKVSEQDAIEKFGELLNESVKKRLRSDVPIGTSLSGGLDSSSIVALCDQFSSRQYSHKCFTVSFAGFEKDELLHAKTIAEKFRLEHFVVEIDENDIDALMNEVMSHQEEPFSSASVLAQYKLFQLARQNGVTVLLDGQGADELLAGYHKYYKWYWQELYRTSKLNETKEIIKARELGIKERFSLQHKLAATFPEFAGTMLQTRKAKAAFRHTDLDRDFAFSNKQNLYYSLPSEFSLNGALYFNSFVYGLEDLLRLADRNSMAHGTEVRLPFLNFQLVEFLFTLPAHFKIHHGWTKWILRKTMEEKLPASITWRKDKLGFEPPQKKWMENKNVQEAIIEGKRKLASQHILNESALQKKIKPHSAYAADNQDWKYWSASFLFD